MIKAIQDSRLLKLLRKQTWYCRARRYLPMADGKLIDDTAQMPQAEWVEMAWPANIKKPRVALVPDCVPCPHWTKFARFLRHNDFDHELFNIHASDWNKRAQEFDLVVGFWSGDLCDLEELREKFFFLHTWLGKAVFPPVTDAMLYENKRLEFWIGNAFGLPFAPTFISYQEDDALQAVPSLKYPLLSKPVPSSGSVGIELVRSPERARRIIRQAFSPSGRKTHFSYARQKQYVYFQQFVPNDGYDIRVIVVGNRVFGYYRKVPEGDYRASGMNLIEKRELPAEAMAIARKLYSVLHSPMIVVDMVHGHDGLYRIIEFSPVCAMEFPEQLHVGGTPGAYIFDETGGYRFQAGKYWVAELALREFLLHHYLPANKEQAQLVPVPDVIRGPKAEMASPRVSRTMEAHAGRDRMRQPDRTRMADLRDG